MKRFFFAAIAVLLLAVPSRADEGMWMVNGLSHSLVQRMQAMGLEMDGKAIYDVENESLCSAIVSLSFIGTGSMISPDGLLITNHHCAYADVFALSTPECNYLEDGFWARSHAEEIPIPGKKIQYLQKIVEVTSEVEEMLAEAKAEGRILGSRKLSYLVEKKWKDETGLEASLSSMWAGSKYYISLYKEYSDVRLVAAPPVCIAAFGGDIDNWEWPQHKCDFALYRVYGGKDGEPAEYSSDNVPVTPFKYLKISEAGIDEGDFTMVLGFPGRTDRYSSSYKVDYLTNFQIPISNEVRAEQMVIIRKWMDSDPAIRLMYSDKFFSLSNLQENQEGEAQCCKRFKVVREKKRAERGIARSSAQLLKSLDSTYAAIKTPESDLIWFRETMIRGNALALVATRLKNTKKPLDMDKEYSSFDMRVEKDLFAYGLKMFYSNVDSRMWGAYQKELYDKFSGDCDAIVSYLWIDEQMTKESPIYLFLTDVTVADFNAKVTEAQGTKTLLDLNREYTRSMYNHYCNKGVDQYPDANSTLRLTYGTVGSFRRDGRMLPWQTYSDQILLKENPAQYEFKLKSEWHDLLASSHASIPVNFVTNNDITGGNSGSPVLNGRGEVIGLAFDGNKESLSGDVLWNDTYNKCVCVDIRFVLWVLKEYAHMDALFSELGI